MENEILSLILRVSNFLTMLMLHFIHAVPLVIAGEHTTLKSASSKVDLCQSEESGNYVVAKEHLNTGDTIVVEEPMAACLRPEYFGSHCLNCLKRYET